MSGFFVEFRRSKIFSLLLDFLVFGVSLGSINCVGALIFWGGKFGFVFHTLSPMGLGDECFSCSSLDLLHVVMVFVSLNLSSRVLAPCGVFPLISLACKRLSLFSSRFGDCFLG